MPIKLFPPRKEWSPYYRGRGTHLGVYVNRSTQARERTLALKVIKKWEGEIERGKFAQAGEPTFASAALAYMQAGGERRFLTKLLKHFGETPLSKIGQAEIDSAAAVLYPKASAATRNRQVYTPVSSVLKRAGMKDAIDRPIGAQGKEASFWLWPEQAEAIFRAARELDPEFAVLLILLCYTGLRLSEALGLMVNDVRLSESFVYVPETKPGVPRPVFLPEVVVQALQAHPRGLQRPGKKLFKWSKSGHIYSLLRAVCARAGVDLPERTAFHAFRHTFGTWMMRYAGLNTTQLVSTGTWKSQKSASRYTHTVVSEEARKAAMLPVGAPPEEE